MNAAEQNLRTLFGDGRAVESPRFMESACTGSVGDYNVLIQLECGEGGVYTLRISLTHQQNGLIHEPHTISIASGCSTVNGESKPNAGVLLPEIRERIVREAGKYLDQFRKPEDRLFLRSDMVYICVPPGDGKEPNMNLARQMAQEALAAGNIPVCPCLLFLSLGNGEKPVDVEPDTEQAVIRRMVEACDRVLAGETPWTQETWAAVRWAKKKGIPVVSNPGQSD